MNKSTANNLEVNIEDISVLNERVCVEIFEKDNTFLGIELVKPLNEGLNPLGTVFRVAKSGSIVVAEGDTILVPKHSGQFFTDKESGRKFVFVNERDIIASWGEKKN